MVDISAGSDGKKLAAQNGSSSRAKTDNPFSAPAGSELPTASTIVDGRVYVMPTWISCQVAKMYSLKCQDVEVMPLVVYHENVCIPCQVVDDMPTCVHHRSIYDMISTNLYTNL